MSVAKGGVNLRDGDVSALRPSPFWPSRQGEQPERDHQRPNEQDRSRQSVVVAKLSVAPAEQRERRPRGKEIRREQWHADRRQQSDAARSDHHGTRQIDRWQNQQRTRGNA